MKSFQLIFIFILASVFSACTPTSSTRSDKSTSYQYDSQGQLAIELYNNGEYANAAALFESLGIRQPPEGWEWQLWAADAYLRAGDIEKARSLLEPLQNKMLSKNGLLRLRLVNANLLLKSFNPEEALSILQTPPETPVDPTLLYQYYELTAEAYRLSGNALESARVLQKLDQLLIDEPEKRLDNQLAILRSLTVLTDDALQLMQPQPAGTQGGWMELARLIKQNGLSPEKLQPHLETWKLQFAGHPAMPELLDGYFTRLGAEFKQASHIAVLLPLSGAYQTAAEALKQGLMAAWYEDAPDKRPILKFYDSSNPENVWPLYNEAVERGADFVIGPLQKKAVSQLLNAGELPVAVLALNKVTSNIAPPVNFFQYALSPEDEARQVAEHAWVNGKRLPVVFYPADAWGERIQTAFVERWQSLGGDITSAQPYDSSQYDFAEPIKSTLRIDQSQQRRKRLQSLLGTQLEFEPRRREDVDFIFLAAKAAKARQIRPQIQFHHANDLPVYTTSSAWPGYVNINRDRDIEGILFPDIPWLLADEGSESLSLSAYNNTMGITQSGAYRLVAMGIDSYQLLAHLARLQNSPDEALDGKTGQLYMDRLNNIHRQLVWAEMKNSIPRVTGYAPRINSGFFDSQQAEPVETNLEPSSMENNPGPPQGI